MPANYSQTEENYLKTIFHLQEGTKAVTTNELAEKLHTRAASVTDMMKKLNSKKLLNYKPYYGFSLSGEGRKVALNIIRRHRLWEFFLAEKLQFNWDEVHEVAEHLEHVSNKKLIEKLDEYLGFPRFDPHGDPIPDSKGRMKAFDEKALNELPVGIPAEVCRVSNQSPVMLDLLQHKNIGIGTKVEIKKLFDFDRSIELKVKNLSITISEQLAKNIYVTYELQTK